MIRFTKEEKIVLLFLLAALFVGTTALYYKKMLAPPFRAIEFDDKEIEKSKKIDINRAEMHALMRVKGIGPVLAGRIVSYREKYGPFKNIEDIKNVKGIGKKTYEKIRGQIVLE